MLKENELRRLLREFVDVVCDEAAQNPEFAGRLVALLDQRAAPLPKRQKARQTPDPFQVLSDRGIHALRSLLEKLQIHELRDIVRAHRLDPSRLSDKWKSKERFVDFVLERVEARSKQGDVFRQYGSRRSVSSEPDEPIATASQQHNEGKKGKANRDEDKENQRLRRLRAHLDYETPQRTGAGGMFQVISITDEHEKDYTRLVDQGTLYTNLASLSSDIAKALGITTKDVELTEV